MPSKLLCSLPGSPHPRPGRGEWKQPSYFTGAPGANGLLVWFVLQDDYIPYPSIDEVGAPWPHSSLFWVSAPGWGWGS